MRWLLQFWYHRGITPSWLLLPLGWLFQAAAGLRRTAYRRRWLKSCRLPVPVVVVGNITVGGTGKTPLVIWLADYLKAAGYRPGIVSRGYGGRASRYPCRVKPESRVEEVGDEALLLARRSSCPLAVGPSRVEAAQLLLRQTDCDLILSDDGLQHYALARTLEIAVIDGGRRFGNGLPLPAGPLREPVSRLKTVDLVIVNGEADAPGEYSMTLFGDTAVNLENGESRNLRRFGRDFCHAVAGIGNPDRFFKCLADGGISCIRHRFPDHYRFASADIEFGDGQPVLMTEKDAVKCLGFAGRQHWYVPVQAVPDPHFGPTLLQLLRDRHDRQQTP